MIAKMSLFLVAAFLFVACSNPTPVPIEPPVDQLASATIRSMRLPLRRDLNRGNRNATFY